MTVLRPSWDSYFLMVADTVSLRSDCRRSRVGAVIVDCNQRIISCGYVGTRERGLPGCLEGACPRGLLSYDELPPYSDYSGSGCISVHAEINALDYVGDRHDFLIRQGGAGYQMYVTRRPCSSCELQLTESYGIERIVYRDTQGSPRVLVRNKHFFEAIWS